MALNNESGFRKEREPESGKHAGERQAGEERIAVIAVHGVADQLAGHTATALAELLIAATERSHAQYTLHETQDIALQVEPLQPLAQPDTDGPATHPNLTAARHLRVDPEAA